MNVQMGVLREFVFKMLKKKINKSNKKYKMGFWFWIIVILILIIFVASWFFGNNIPQPPALP